ncbi:phospholipase A2 inhibitor gamma subunit B-like [Pseudophryne corroboree]|uniref:phospholipase A2 inhibitor gamma subunit B-like n=1 Tax=Pseudophryne corroboree TaxID=495146 RepID=UPI00308176FB
MMKSLGFLAVLSALAATGYSITCKSCWQFATACTSPTVSCPAGNVCVSSYSVVQTVTSSTPQIQYSISCGLRDHCNITGSMTFIYGTVRTGTSCCDTDDCTPPTPILPALSSQKNGLTCRTCYSDKSDYCYNGDTLQCNGEETKCGLMSRKLTGTINLNEAIRGCSTKSFCDVLGPQSASISGLNVDAKMYCSDGAVGLNSGILYSIFATLLAKLLL